MTVVTWKPNIASEKIELEPNGVDLWLIDLDRSEREWRQLAQVLTSDEIERAGRFRFDRDRRRYIVARATLRRVLSRYLGSSPKKIRLVYGEYGKPDLATGQGAEAEDLRFNISHSGEKGLLGVTRMGEVGVDIEFIDRHLWDVNETAESVFTEQEIAELREYPDGARVEPFLAGWTRKEAYLKGIGKGLALPLKDFSVTLRPKAERPSLTAPGWQLFAFWATAEYIASVALPEPLSDPRFRTYQAN